MRGFLENVQQILSGCSALAQTKYLQRHNNAFKILFFEVLRSLDLIGKGKDGEIVRAFASHKFGPGSNPRFDSTYGLSLFLVLSLAPRGFFPVTPVFPSSQKATFPNSNSNRNQVDEEPLFGCATSKSLFIYFLFIYY